MKIVNHADQPLHLQEVQVKIVCDGEGDGNHKPIIVTATCPQHCYDSYGSATGKESKHLTIPATASNDDAVSALLYNLKDMCHCCDWQALLWLPQWCWFSKASTGQHNCILCLRSLSLS